MTTSNEHYDITGLSCGKSYNISVTSLLCEVEESEPSHITIGMSAIFSVNNISLILVDLFTSPINLTAIVLSCTTIHLKWTSLTDQFNVSYTIISNSPGDCYNSPCIVYNVTSYNVISLLLETFNYTFTVNGSVCDCKESSRVYIEKLSKLFNNLMIIMILLKLTEPVKGLRIENCNDNSNRRLYWSLPINNTVNIKGYNITITPPPSQTSSDCQCTTGHCNISSDVTSFDINCLDYDVNYTITVIPISVCESLTGERQSVSCLPKKCILNNLLKFM